MRKIILLMSILLTSISFSQNLNILTEEMAPFNFTKGGKVTGLATDLLVSMMKDAGLKYDAKDITMVPWARGYKKAQNEKNTILYSMTRTKERENMFAWVGPIFKLEFGIIAKKGSKIKISSVEDLTKYKIGSVIEDASEQILLKNSKVKKGRLERVSKPEVNIKKLEAGRIDLITSNIPAAMNLISKMGLKTSDYEVVYVMQENEFYYAFQKDSDKATMKKLQMSLDKLVKNGTKKKIIKKYFK